MLKIKSQNVCFLKRNRFKNIIRFEELPATVSCKTVIMG